MSRASDLCGNHKTLQKLFEKLDLELMVSCDECGLMDELTEWGPCTDVHKLAGHNIPLPPILQTFGSTELVSSTLGCNLETQKIPFFHGTPSELLKLKVSKGIIIRIERNCYDLLNVYSSLMYWSQRRYLLYKSDWENTRSISSLSSIRTILYRINFIKNVLAQNTTPKASQTSQFLY